MKAYRRPFASLALAVGLVVPAGGGAAGSPPTAAMLSIAVVGNHLVDGTGKPIRLLGVNRSGTEYACSQGWGVFDGPSDDASIAAIASWKVNAVRVPLNEDCWLGINGVDPAYSGSNYRSAISAYVGRLHAHGLYGILDLHVNAPGTSVASDQQVMPDADHSPAFWSSVATAFRADPAVLFDLYNEPHDVSWACWRDGCDAGGWQAAGMQALVTAVRNAGATQPLMVGGLGWSNDLSGWLSYRPDDPQHSLVASFHLYNFTTCATASCWGATVAPVAAQVPVVTGEVGEDDCATSFIDRYLPWADHAGVSYLAWTWDVWDCRSGPALVTDYNGTPTGFGIGYRDHLATLAAAPGQPYLAVRGSDNGVWVRDHPGPGWNGLGGETVAAPVAEALAGSYVAYFATGTDHQVWVRDDSHGWAPFNTGGAYCVGGPAVAVSSGTLYVGCDGRDGGLWVSTTVVAAGTVPHAAGWSAWGGHLTASPSAFNYADGTAAFAVRGTDGGLWASRGQGWTPLGVNCAGHPSAAGVAGLAIVACPATDQQLVSVASTGSAWNGPVSGGGVIREVLQVRPLGQGWLTDAASPDGGIWEVLIDARGAAASGWQQLSGQTNLSG
jgi:endoglucanase